MDAHEMERAVMMGAIKAALILAVFAGTILLARGIYLGQKEAQAEEVRGWERAAHLR